MNKLLLTALSLLAVNTYAEPNEYYWGANFASFNYELEDPIELTVPGASRDNEAARGRSLNVQSIEGLIGYRINKYLSAEFRAGFGLEGTVNVSEREFFLPTPIDDVTMMPTIPAGSQLIELSSFKTEIEASSFAALYIKPEIFNANGNISLYGLFGISFNQIDVRYDDQRTTVVDNGDDGGRLINVGGDDPDTGNVVEGVINFPVREDSFDNVGLSLGIGTSFEVQKNTTLNVEYRVLSNSHPFADDDDFDFSSRGASIGFTHSFK